MKKATETRNGFFFWVDLLRQTRILYLPSPRFVSFVYCRFVDCSWTNLVFRYSILSPSVSERTYL